MDEKANNKEDIKHSLIKDIKQLAKKDPKFNLEMQNLFGQTSSNSSITQEQLNSWNNLSYIIREALEVRGENSICYNFVKEKDIRNTLIIDNIRMENTLFNFTLQDPERFMIFCVSAFSQIESVVNYYFKTKYPNIKERLELIEKETIIEKDFQFKIPENIKTKIKKGENIKEEELNINAHHKIDAICNILKIPLQTKITLSNIRQLRNYQVHRNHDNNKITKLLEFLNNDFNKVRYSLISLVSAIEEIFSAQILDSIITSIYPGACFIKFENEKQAIQLPEILLSKTKGLNKGDKIKVEIIKDKILDIYIAD